MGTAGDDPDARSNSPDPAAVYAVVACIVKRLIVRFVVVAVLLEVSVTVIAYVLLAPVARAVAS